MLVASTALAAVGCGSSSKLPETTEQSDLHYVTVASSELLPAAVLRTSDDFDAALRANQSLQPLRASGPPGHVIVGFDLILAAGCTMQRLAMSLDTDPASTAITVVRSGTLRLETKCGGASRGGRTRMYAAIPTVPPVPLLHLPHEATESQVSLS